MNIRTENKNMNSHNNDGQSNVVKVAIISKQAFSLVNFRGPLIRAMVERNVIVYAFAPDFDEKTRREVEELGAIPLDGRVHPAGMNPFQDLMDMLWLSRKLRQIGVGATFAYFIKPVIFGTLAAKLAGVPKRFAMIEGLGYAFAEGGNSVKRKVVRGLATNLYRLALSYATKVFFLNPDDKRFFIENAMVRAEKVALIDGIGIDLSHYPMAHLNSESICFVLVARLLKEKGIYDYVEAARRVKKEYPSVRFLLLGNVDASGNPDSIAESKVLEWAAEGLLEWPGHVDDVRPWIASAGVFVLPSYREGLPRSTLEAMATGRAIITTDAPGCKETVVDGLNGFKIPVQDPLALANAMLKFIAEPHLIAQMGKESRRIAENRFDVRKINYQILGVMGIRGRVHSTASHQIFGDMEPIFTTASGTEHM